MANFFTSTIFQYVLLPLFIVFLNIYVKRVSKNDKFIEKLKKEDFAIGLELALSSIIAFALYSVHISEQIPVTNIDGEGDNNLWFNVKDKVVSTPWLITLFIFSFWIMSTIVRKWGWENKSKMTWMFGIIIPFIYGFLTLLGIIYWIGF